MLNIEFMEHWRLTWTKLSPLSNELVSSLPNNLPSVYRLSYKADDGKYYVFYIGQADDIKKRLLQHLSDVEKNVCIKNYRSTKNCFFRYAKVAKDHVRGAAEKQMFRKYEPTCNDKEPEGREDVKVNLI